DGGEPDPGDSPLPPPSVPAVHLRQRKPSRKRIRGVEQVDRFPHIVALAVPLTSEAEPDARFELGLDALVRGIETNERWIGTKVNCSGEGRGSGSAIRCWLAV